MFELTFEVTNYCPNNCLHCSTKANKFGKEDLDLDFIKTTVQKYNPEWVNISGGEPLYYPHIIELVKLLKESKYKVKIYTSGNFINKHILQELKDLNVDRLIISFHTLHEGLFNLITQEDSYRNVVNTIDTALNLSMPVEIHITPMSITLDSLDDTIEYLKTKNIKKISLLKLVKQGRCNNNDYLIPKDYAKIYKIYKNNKNLIRLGSPFNKETPCTAGVEKLVVMYDGNIIPCESYKDGYCKCERL